MLPVQAEDVQVSQMVGLFPRRAVQGDSLADYLCICISAGLLKDRSAFPVQDAKPVQPFGMDISVNTVKKGHGATGKKGQGILDPHLNIAFWRKIRGSFGMVRGVVKVHDVFDLCPSRSDWLNHGIKGRQLLAKCWGLWVVEVDQ